MMRSLLSVSLCLLLVCSACAPSLTRGCRKEGRQLVRKEQLPPMVDASGHLCKYNMTVDFMRKHFSGLLLVRETANGTYRTLFSTHFGLSLFDLEIGRDTLIVHRCIEPLNKKKILTLFRSDFAVLFGLNLHPENEAILYTCPASPVGSVYRLTTPGAKGYYAIDRQTGALTAIRIGSGLWKTSFSVLPADSPQSPVIRIRHSGLKLSIGLEKLE